MHGNEEGITLVELLATLVIAFFFIGIIYSVAILGMNYFKVETSKTRLQQEANYIITELQRIHREGNCYILSISTNQVVVKDCSVEEQVEIVSSGFNYEVIYDNNGNEIDPLRENVLLEDFVIKDPENNNLKVEISTVISRYQSNNSEGGD